MLAIKLHNKKNRFRERLMRESPSGCIIQQVPNPRKDEVKEEEEVKKDDDDK